MKKTISILSLSAISVFMFYGCTTSESSFLAPDGSTYKTVKCSQNSLECLQTASEGCPNGKYKVISSESHAGGLIADIIPGPVTWYSMVYKCGLSGTGIPTFPYTEPSYIPYTPPVQHNSNIHHSRSASSATSTYQGASGNTYKYDLNTIGGRMGYKLDPGAQLNDSIKRGYDAGYRIDSNLGQSGGGINY